MGTLKVVLVGIYYPVAILRYVEAALRRREDVELFTVGPYTGTQIPWGSGMFLNVPDEFSKAPDAILPMGLTAHVEYVEQKLPWKPDVWIQMDAAYHLVGKPKNGKNLIVGTDPHCVNYDYDRSVADKFFCMQTPYMKPGDVWLPYAYDPVWHTPTGADKIYDFGIVGADGRQGPLYANRDWLVKALRDKGYKVLQVFGEAYGSYRTLLNQCKVGLNWSTQLDTTARVFETMAMGCALLTNRTPDLDKIGFIDGDSFWGFSSRDNALLAADVLMQGDFGLGNIQPQYIRTAQTGRRTVAPHTWDARVAEVLSYA